MAKLKLGPLVENKPVRLTVDLPAHVHRDLVAYAEVLGREEGGPAAEAAKLVAPMLARFMDTDRAFAKERRRTDLTNKEPGDSVRLPRPGAETPGEHG